MYNYDKLLNYIHMYNYNKATPIGNYVSGPPPASFFTESEISEMHGEYARIRFSTKLDFKNKYWAAINMLNLTAYVLLYVFYQ